MISHKWRLDGKKALVTGASKGIGYAISQTFLEFGAEVIVTARNSDTLNACVDSWTNLGLKASGIASDVSEESGRRVVVDYVKERFGALDILVNNAGTNIRKPTMEYKDEELLTIVNTNITSAFMLSRMCHDLLKASGSGCIVNVSSIAGMGGMRSGAAYGMTKAAMNQMTRNLGVEWAKDNIRVNAVAPGFTKTPLTEFWQQNDSAMKEIQERTPLGRMGEAEEIAAAVAFLALPVSSFTTCQVLVVDGGLLTKTF